MSTAEWIASQIGHVDIAPGVAVMPRSPRPPKKVKVRDVARPARQNTEEESVVATSSPETKQEVSMSTAAIQYPDPTNPLAYLGAPPPPAAPADVAAGANRPVPPGAPIVIDFTRPGGEAATIVEKFNQRDLAAARTYDNFIQSNVAKLYGPGTYTVYQVAPDGKKKPVGLVAIAAKLPGSESAHEPKTQEVGAMKEYLEAVKQISANEQARAREDAARREREVEKNESLLGEVFKTMIARGSSGGGMEALMPLLVMQSFSQNRPQVAAALQAPTSVDAINLLASKIDQYLSPQPSYPEPPAYPPPPMSDQESPVAGIGQVVGSLVELLKVVSPPPAQTTDPLAGVRLGLELAAARESKETRPTLDVVSVSKEILTVAGPILASVGTVLATAGGFVKSYLDNQKHAADEARAHAEARAQKLEDEMVAFKERQFRELEQKASSQKSLKDLVVEAREIQGLFATDGGGGSSPKEWMELAGNFLRARQAGSAPAQAAAPPPAPTIVVLRESETLPDGTQTMRQFGQLFMTHPGGILPDGQMAPPQYAIYPLITTPVTPPAPQQHQLPPAAPQPHQVAPQATPATLPATPEFLEALRQLSMAPSEAEILRHVAAALSIVLKDPIWRSPLSKLLHALKEGRKMDAAGEVRGLFNYFASNLWMPEVAARRATEAVLANYDDVAQFAQAGMLDVN